MPCKWFLAIDSQTLELLIIVLHQPFKYTEALPNMCNGTSTCSNVSGLLDGIMIHVNNVYYKTHGPKSMKQVRRLHKK